MAIADLDRVFHNGHIGNVELWTLIFEFYLSRKTRITQIRAEGLQLGGASQFLTAGGPGTKLQTPKKHQVQNTKHQAPNSREAPSSKLDARAAVWSLELGISLVFGAWFLVFRFRDFTGAWGLVLGVSLSGGRKLRMRPRTLQAVH